MQSFNACATNRYLLHNLEENRPLPAPSSCTHKKAIEDPQLHGGFRQKPLERRYCGTYQRNQTHIAFLSMFSASLLFAAYMTVDIKNQSSWFGRCRISCVYGSLVYRVSPLRGRKIEEIHYAHHLRSRDSLRGAPVPNYIMDYYKRTESS